MLINSIDSARERKSGGKGTNKRGENQIIFNIFNDFHQIYVLLSFSKYNLWLRLTLYIVFPCIVLTPFEP